MKNSKIFIYHISAWLCFIFYEVGGVYATAHRVSSVWDYFVNYTLTICLFYFSACIVSSNIGKTGKFKYFLLLPIVFLEVTLYIGFNYLLNNYLEYLHIKILSSGKIPNIIYITAAKRAIYIIVLSNAYWIYTSFLKFKKNTAEVIKTNYLNLDKQTDLEKRLKQSENAFLQSQINTHLLFNTLNFVYNAVENVSSEAAEAVMLLAEISQYSLKSVDGNGKVPLKDEVLNINKMICLNQIRFQSNLNINFHTDGNFDGFTISPLLFLTFIENIFKHADLTDPQKPACINISTNEQEIVLNIKNKTNQYLIRGNEIGVANARLRLAKYYPEKHLIAINQNDTNYELTLKLDINNVEMLHSR